MRMRRRVALLSASCLLHGAGSLEGAEPAPTILKTNSTVRSLLTASEIGTMFRVAKAWGFHDFTEVTIAPDGAGDTNIVLKTTDQRAGRKVTFRKIEMNRAHWLSYIQALEGGYFHVFEG